MIVNLMRLLNEQFALSIGKTIDKPHETVRRQDRTRTKKRSYFVFIYLALHVRPCCENVRFCHEYQFDVFRLEIPTVPFDFDSSPFGFGIRKVISRLDCRTPSGVGSPELFQSFCGQFRHI